MDVIEVEAAVLSQRVAETRDLREAEAAHDAFLRTCVTQACLDIPQFTNCLSALLTLCKLFCLHVQVLAPFYFRV